MVTLHHFPALCCRTKKQTRIQSHHFASSVLGLHPEGGKKLLLSLCQHSQDIPVLGLTLSNTPKEQLRRQLCHMQHFILWFRVLTSHCTVTLQTFFHPAVCSGAFMCFGLRRVLSLHMKLMQQSAEHLIYPRSDILESCMD